MKINPETWSKFKAHCRRYAWPWAISTLLTVFIMPISAALSISPFWMLPLDILIWIPWALADYRRASNAGQQERLQLQAKYDAEDKAMFGGSL